MKAEFDNEIDALLRRNARAAGGGARGDGGRATTHLDADELSAFAEDALPAAARLSVVSHLADCGECRAVVVRLSSAAGEVRKRAAVDPSEAAPRAASRGWLAALFSPRALRFVAPALALCLLGALALVMLRARREAAPNTVAMRGEERDSARPGAAPESQPAANANASANANTNAEGPTGLFTYEDQAADANRAADADAPAPRAPRAAAPVTESPDGSADRTGDALSQPAQEATRAEAVAPPPPPAADAGGAAATSAPRPAAPEEPKEKKADESRGQAREAEVARNEADAAGKRGAQTANTENRQAPDTSARRPASSTLGGARAASPAPHQPARRNRSLSGPADRREAGEDTARDRADDESGAETRTVAGRRFRRQGGAWVDVNYRPAMAMTGVRRGTEGYRALVADHPELGRIAEQLGGEVIAVIGGRAYRIR